MKNESITRLEKNRSAELSRMLQSFEPLLIKYARLLDDPDAYYDLQETFLQAVSRINHMRNSSPGAVTNYIRNAVYHRFIALSKAQNQYKQSHILLGEATAELAENTVAGTLSEDSPVFMDLDILRRGLTGKEFEIIVLHYYYGYSITEIAKFKHVSRQCVNQTKLLALKKLKAVFQNLQRI